MERSVQHRGDGGRAVAQYKHDWKARRVFVSIVSIANDVSGLMRRGGTIEHSHRGKSNEETP